MGAWGSRGGQFVFECTFYARHAFILQTDGVEIGILEGQFDG
jgi:hypothetical protein